MLPTTSGPAEKEISRYRNSLMVAKTGVELPHDVQVSSQSSRDVRRLNALESCFFRSPIVTKARKRRIAGLGICRVLFEVAL